MASGGGKGQTVIYDVSTYLGVTHEGVLWRAIAAQGLDANDFQAKLSELRGYEWKLSHEPTGQALHVSKGLTRSTSQADLLLTRPDGDPTAVNNANQSTYIELIREWAAKLRAAQPGRQQISGGPTLIGSPDGQAGNQPFTPAEQAEIANQIKAIRDSVRKNYRLTAEQLAAIDKYLEEAEEASKRLGRKDWRSLFYGIVFGLIVNDAIPPEVAQHIFTGVLHGLAHVLGAGIPPGPWILGR